MFFDTHAHLNFTDFIRDRDSLVKKCLKNNVWLINVGTNFFTSQKALNIAQEYEQGVYAAIGLHPGNLEAEFTENLESETKGPLKNIIGEEFNYQGYKKLAQDKKVVAIGEIGLDYFLKPESKKRLERFKKEQDFLFHQQVRLAKELDLPMILHCRRAHEDFLRILRKLYSSYDRKFQGVIHCFTGNIGQARKYIELGFLLGFNGIIFKLNLKDIIKKVPLDKMLIETDCPYLSPPGYDKKRNDPLGVKFVAEEIASIKKLSLEEVAHQTTQNAQKLFLKKI